MKGETEKGFDSISRSPYVDGIASFSRHPVPIQGEGLTS